MQKYSWVRQVTGGTVILKGLIDRIQASGMDPTGQEQGPVAGCCEYGSECLGVIS